MVCRFLRGNFRVRLFSVRRHFGAWKFSRSLTITAVTQPKDSDLLSVICLALSNKLKEEQNYKNTNCSDFFGGLILIIPKLKQSSRTSPFMWGLSVISVYMLHFG